MPAGVSLSMKSTNCLKLRKITHSIVSEVHELFEAAQENTFYSERTHYGQRCSRDHLSLWSSRTLSSCVRLSGLGFRVSGFGFS